MKNYRILIVYIVLSILIFSGCKESTSKSELYDEQWRKGRRIYIENCSACHIGIDKDKIFEDFIIQLSKSESSLKSKILTDVLFDSNHSGKNINTEQLSKKEIEALVRFIETPQKKEIVN